MPHSLRVLRPVTAPSSLFPIWSNQAASAAEVQSPPTLPPRSRIKHPCRTYIPCALALLPRCLHMMTSPPREHSALPCHPLRETVRSCQISFETHLFYLLTSIFGICSLRLLFLFTLLSSLVAFGQPSNPPDPYHLETPLGHPLHQSGLLPISRLRGRFVTALWYSSSCGGKGGCSFQTHHQASLGNTASLHLAQVSNDLHARQ